MNEPTGLEDVTPARIPDTSATERAAFRRCRRQWFLSVVHRLDRVGGSESLLLGTLVHKGLEVFYKFVKERQDEARAGGRPMSVGAILGLDHWYGSAVDAALDGYQAEYDASIAPIEEALGFLWPRYEQVYKDLGQLGMDMLQAYFERERRDPVVDEVVDVERRVYVPIRHPRSGRRVGRLSVMTDLVGTRAGRFATVDHKTAARDHSSAQLDLDDQLTAEVYSAWIAYGRFPEEAGYNVLKKQVPRPPKRLKDARGGVPRLSKDQGQPTTFELYAQAVRELEPSGLDPDDYKEHLEWLAGQRDDRFFAREFVFRTQSQLASFERNLYEEWRDMRAVALHPERAYPSPSPFSCPSCPVRLLCTTMMDSGDFRAVAKAEYVVRDPRR